MDQRVCEEKTGELEDFWTRGPEGCVNLRQENWRTLDQRVCEEKTGELENFLDQRTREMEFFIVMSSGYKYKV
ncbi:MAG: hypothetical protein K2O87_04730 [Duncaniella freteri]|nr:hypothetical protein [Duncaniella freteri]